MTPQSPKAVTAEEIATKLILELRMDGDARLGLTTTECIWVSKCAEQIKLAREGAIQEDRDKRTAQDLYKHSYAKGFFDGQVAMRERAAIYFIQHGGTLTDIAKGIRALHPHAPEEGK